MFQWTDEMKNVGATPELEGATRQAVISAIEYYSALEDGVEWPRFSGNHVITASNEAGVKMLAEIGKHLPDTLVGYPRARILTTAIAVASRACSGRKGESAFGALAQLLAKPTQK